MEGSAAHPEQEVRSRTQRACLAGYSNEPRAECEAAPDNTRNTGEAAARNDRLVQRISENLEPRRLMGGYSSGRYRTRNRGTVDGRIRLDIRALRRQGFLRPGAITAGTQRWTWVATGEEHGSVTVSVNLANPDAGLVTLTFRLDGGPREQVIRLIGVPMRYGGRRYYFLCPRQHRRCEVLPMVGGVFASRQAHRLTYQSQSHDHLGRLREKSWKLEKRLWPKDGRRRPRGRNRERLVEAWSEAECAFDDLFAVTVMRRWGKLL